MRYSKPDTTCAANYIPVIKNICVEVPPGIVSLILPSASIPVSYQTIAGDFLSLFKGKLTD